MKPTLATYEDCTGCGACAASCTHDALRMVVDKNGFLMPKIEESKCICCHLCEKRCPSLNLDKNVHHNPHDINFYTAWSKDDEVCMHSTSGGVFSQIAINFLREGYSVVFGAHLTGDNQVHHIGITDDKDLPLIQGTYYIQSDASPVYTEIKKALKDGLKVLFCGTPCQVAGVYASLGYKDHENLYTVELVCHGVASSVAVDISLKYHNTIRFISWRDKNEGWMSKTGQRNGQQQQQQADGTILRFKNGDSCFNRIFAPCHRLSCTTCHYAQISRVADVSLADQWNLAKSLKDRWNLGASLVLTNTSKGVNMIHSNNLHAEKIGGKDVNSWTLFHPAVSPKISIAKRLWLFKYLPNSVAVNYLSGNWRKAPFAILRLLYIRGSQQKYDIEILKKIEEVHKEYGWL